MALRAVLNGRFAEASIDGVKIGNLTDWKVEVDTTNVDLTAHGDGWKRIKPTVSGWKFTAKSFVGLASAAHIINGFYASGGAVGLVTVAGFSGSVATGTKIFEGAGYVASAFLDAPMAVATQGFELEGDGTPTTGV